MKHINLKLTRLLKSKCSVYILFFFYLAAGVNHFINPSFYLPLIPDYLPYHPTINIISGIAEIILAVAIHFRAIRKVTAYLLILMLVAFIPSHIYFIHEGSCIQSVLCVAEWIGWARLLVIHPLLIYWALMVGKSADK